MGQHQDAGSIPSRTQWVKGSAIGHNCGSDLIPGLGTPFAVGWPEKGGGGNENRIKKHLAKKTIISEMIAHQTR